MEEDTKVIILLLLAISAIVAGLIFGTQIHLQQKDIDCKKTFGLEWEARSSSRGADCKHPNGDGKYL